MIFTMQSLSVTCNTTLCELAEFPVHYKALEFSIDRVSIRIVQNKSNINCVDTNGG